jgi:RimJ/RimL family protein N-acetyltransferase
MKNYKEKLKIVNALPEQERFWMVNDTLYNCPEYEVLYSKLIKNVGFCDIHYPIDCDYPLILIGIHPHFWHQKIGYNLLFDALNYAKDNIPKVKYIVNKENKPSIYLVESFNFDYYLDLGNYYEYYFES